MTDRDKFRRDIRKIAEDSQAVDEDIAAYVKKEFTEALRKAGDAAEESKEIAGDILLAVEAGLKDAGKESGKALVRATEGLADIAGDIAGQSRDAVSSYARSLRALTIEAIKHSRSALDDLENFIGEHKKNTGKKE